MRKLLITTLTMLSLLLVFGTASAQDAIPMDKGFKVGLSLSKFTGDDADFGTVSPDYRTGFVFGGFLGFNVSPVITIQPEVLYVMKGSKYEEGGDKLTFKMDYLEIPVAIKYKFTTEGNVNPNLYFGPAIAFKLSSKVEAEEDGVTAEADFDEVNGTDFGIFFGGGIEFDQDTYKILLDVRFTVGMTDIPDTSEDVGLKHSNLSFMVGLGF